MIRDDPRAAIDRWCDGHGAEDDGKRVGLDRSTSRVAHGMPAPSTNLPAPARDPPLSDRHAHQVSVRRRHRSVSDCAGAIGSADAGRHPAATARRSRDDFVSAPRRLRNDNATTLRPPFDDPSTSVRPPLATTSDGARRLATRVESNQLVTNRCVDASLVAQSFASPLRARAWSACTARVVAATTVSRTSAARARRRMRMLARASERQRRRARRRAHEARAFCREPMFMRVCGKARARARQPASTRAWHRREAGRDARARGSRASDTGAERRRRGKKFVARRNSKTSIEVESNV